MSECGDFHHEAFFYADPDEFLAGTVPFVREGIGVGEAVMVAVPRHKLEPLRDALGADAGPVHLAAMEEIGRNPARIISAWHDFLAANRRRGVRGIGEPIWAGRSEAEVDECRRHEALLNHAFAGGREWPLLCPYDVGALDDEVLLAAERSHPAIHGGRSRSIDYESEMEEVFAGSLGRPQGEMIETVFAFDAEGLHSVRRLVFGEAARAALDPGRAGDLVLAASEVAANSVRHGGGVGVLQIWRSNEQIVCEFRDSGRIADPLVGRKRPGIDEVEGRGLWVANQLCDLVQIRWDGENVVRLQMSAP
jgi:anti-sigma regulatory factor (Ser/Thr protein kinase)